MKSGLKGFVYRELRVLGEMGRKKRNGFHCFTLALQSRMEGGCFEGCSLHRGFGNGRNDGVGEAFALMRLQDTHKLRAKKSVPFRFRFGEHFVLRIIGKRLSLDCEKSEYFVYCLALLVLAIYLVTRTPNGRQTFLFESLYL